MRNVVCLILFLTVFLFAETHPVADANGVGEPTETEGELEDDSLEYIDGSARSVGVFKYISHDITKARETVSFGWDVTAWTNHIDYNMGWWLGKRIASGLYLNALGLNLHILSDVGDSCTNPKGCARIGAGVAFNTAFALIAALEELSGGSDNLGRYWFVFAALQNPILEFFVVRKYVPVSVELGYNTDWFAFSPGHEFYFRAHGDLNVNILFVRVAVSYSYSFLDTYDLEKGSKKFYLKLIFGPMSFGF